MASFFFENFYYFRFIAGVLDFINTKTKSYKKLRPTIAVKPIKNWSNNYMIPNVKLASFNVFFLIQTHSNYWNFVGIVSQQG